MTTEEPKNDLNQRGEVALGENMKIKTKEDREIDQWIKEVDATKEAIREAVDKLDVADGVFLEAALQLWVGVGWDTFGCETCLTRYAYKRLTDALEEEADFRKWQEEQDDKGAATS